MTDNSNTSTATPKLPKFRKQLPNGISAAVFENTRNGRTYRSVNLQRSYKRDGKWNRMSLYLDHEHIPFVQEALQGVWNFLNSVPPTSFSESEQPVDNASEDSSGVITDSEAPLETEEA